MCVQKEIQREKEKETETERDREREREGAPDSTRIHPSPADRTEGFRGENRFGVYIKR